MLLALGSQVAKAELSLQKQTQINQWIAEGLNHHPIDSKFVKLLTSNITESDLAEMSPAIQNLNRRKDFTFSRSYGDEIRRRIAK